MPGKVGTYDEALPTERDQIRAQLADTDQENFLLSDIHIDAVLTLRASVSLAVVALAMELVAEFGRQPVRRTEGGESVDYSDRLDSWKVIISEAKADSAASTGQGGITFVPATYSDANPSDEFSRPIDY